MRWGKRGKKSVHVLQKRLDGAGAVGGHQRLDGAGVVGGHQTRPVIALARLPLLGLENLATTSTPTIVAGRIGNEVGV